MDTSRGNQDWLPLLLGDVRQSLPRERLVNMFVRLRPRAVLLTAASGYGKTTCAAQFASLRTFRSRVWVRLDDSQPSSQRLLLALHRALEQAAGVDSALLVKDLREQELLQQVVATVSGLPSPVCMVIDDLGQLQNPALLSSLVQRLSDVSAESCLIVTTRQSPNLDLQAARFAWTIGADGLRFTLDETKAYLMSLSRESLTDQAAEHLHNTSEGQVALLSVLARHMLSTGTQTATADRDASQCFTRIVRSCCSQFQQDCLYAAALLKTGRVGELVEVLGPRAAGEFRSASKSLPLVKIADARASTTGHFVVHDIAESILTSSEFEDYLGSTASSIYCRALEVLFRGRNYDRLFELLLARGDQQSLVGWLERVGEELAAQCSTQLLARCLEAVPATSALTRPRLLLLQAHLLRLTDLLPEAERKARVVLQLANDTEDADTQQSATLLLANISFDLGDFASTRSYLTSFLTRVQESESDDVAVLYSYLAKCSICLGEFDRAAEEIQRIGPATGDASPLARGLRLKADGLLQGFVLGNLAAAVPVYSAAVNIDEIGVNEQLIAYGNLGTALCELGRLQRAESTIAEVLSKAERLDLTYLQHGFSGSLAGVRAAVGAYDSAVSIMSDSIRGSEELGCVFDVVMNSSFASTILRACGLLDEALLRAEAALERSSEVCFLPGEWMASIELAASLLALGDEAIPFARAKGMRSNPSAQPCQHIQLRASMLIAEILRRRGDGAGAVAELDTFRDYVLSESPNWICAMYIRAFPGLLGLLAKSVGPELLPIHLLRMVLPENATVALPMAREVLSKDEWNGLALRTVGETGVEGDLTGSAPEPECHIRMFGGFEVRTSSGVVAQRAWKKRKARLLFAMLAVRQGKDVPREQLLEYLWPEMDEERARNNMYVVWNAMKTALAPAAGSGGARPVLAENAGGVCRINPRQVRSDLDDFADALHSAREAETAGDVLLAAGYYEQLRDIYRGELLPGDIYDDWFAPIREKYRHEFGDAMARCAVLLEQEDPPRGLGFVRAALSFDPWREDLYQLTLRLQICTGQRSAAIETYLACRTRLAEDLGLDPSIETRRLYDQVLAMEDPACGPRDAA